jgi:hypothetical protein
MEMKNCTMPTITGICEVVGVGRLSTYAMYTVGPPVSARMTRRNMNRVVRWEALFHVVGIYMNSASVAKSMINVATAPPRAVADQVIAGDGNCEFGGAYTLGELNAV